MILVTWTPCWGNSDSRSAQGYTAVNMFVLVCHISHLMIHDDPCNLNTMFGKLIQLQCKWVYCKCVCNCVSHLKIIKNNSRSAQWASSDQPGRQPVQWPVQPDLESGEPCWHLLLQAHLQKVDGENIVKSKQKLWLNISTLYQVSLSIVDKILLTIDK